MEKIKLQETKKSCRSLLRNNKSILFDITKEMYLKYFCENLKDIIIVEKLLLILEALIKSQNLIIHKKEDIKSNKKNKRQPNPFNSHFFSSIFIIKKGIPDKLTKSAIAKFNIKTIIGLSFFFFININLINVIFIDIPTMNSISIKIVGSIK